MSLEFLEDAVPLQEAARRMGDRTPVGAALNSAEWGEVPVALRERAFFSAQVTRMDVLRTMDAKLQRRINLLSEKVAHGERLVDRSSFIRDMRVELERSGYMPEPGKEGTIEDLMTRGRLGLIFDHNTGPAQEYARFKAGSAPGALAAFPAWELVREEEREVPRQWRARWSEAGGQFHNGRMIARKGDPVWTAISRFGTPYPPFDFQSGMGTRDVSREEALELGVTEPGEEPERPDVKFNEELRASARGVRPELLESLKQTFGDQLRVVDDQVVWRGNLIGDLFEQALADPQWKGRVNLGTAWRPAVEAAREAGEDIAGYTFDLSADDVRHVMSKHGSERELLRGQRPVTKRDFELLPDVLRTPDVVGLADAPDTIGFTKELEGRQITFWWLRSRKKKSAGLKTMWVRRTRK